MKLEMCNERGSVSQARSSGFKFVTKLEFLKAMQPHFLTNYFYLL